MALSKPQEKARIFFLLVFLPLCMCEEVQQRYKVLDMKLQEK